jgi:hypothetical protein
LWGGGANAAENGLSLRTGCAHGPMVCPEVAANWGPLRSSPDDSRSDSVSPSSIVPLPDVKIAIAVAAALLDCSPGRDETAIF